MLVELTEFWIWEPVSGQMPYWRAISGDSVRTVNGKGIARWLSIALKEEYFQSVSQLEDAIRINADVF